MNTQVIEETTAGAFAGRMPFPEVVKRLIPIGTERYTADLVRMQKTYYFKNGESHVHPLPLTDAPPLAQDFDDAAISAAIKAIQAGKIAYPEFLRKIIAAGCSHYSVFIDGRHAAYYGHKGETHIEKFPGAK